MEFFSKLLSKLKELKLNSMYWIIGGVVFFLGLLAHFPLEHFGSVITSTIQKQTGYIVQMEKISLALPVGVYGENVTIRQPPAPISEGITPVPIHFDKITIRPSVFGLLLYPFRKAFGFSFKAVREKEIWSGFASFGQENSSFNVKARNFHLETSFLLDQTTMFPGKTVSLNTIVDLDVSLDGKTVALQQGNLSLSDGYVSIHSKKIDIQAPVVNTLSLNDFNLESDLKKGALTIKTLDFQGPTITAKSKGDIKIAPFFPNSQLNLQAQIKIDSQDPNLSSVGFLLTSINKPASDGTISMKITGPLGAPNAGP